MAPPAGQHPQRSTSPRGGVPTPILQSPSASDPFPPTHIQALRGVEIFFSYQPFYCPLLPGYTVIANRTPGKDGLVPISSQSTVYTGRREKVPSVVSGEAGKRHASRKGAGRPPKRTRHPRPGAYGETCTAKSGRKRKKVMARPEVPGGTLAPALSPAPAQRTSLPGTQ